MFAQGDDCPVSCAQEQMLDIGVVGISGPVEFDSAKQFKDRFRTRGFH